MASVCCAGESRDRAQVMLRETRRRIVEEKLPVDNLELVRVDVAELPMSDGSISAMHAGAALHSWPRLEAGLAEIHRVLEPSGRFWASTFLQARDLGATSARSWRTHPDDSAVRAGRIRRPGRA